VVAVVAVAAAAVAAAAAVMAADAVSNPTPDSKEYGRPTSGLPFFFGPTTGGVHSPRGNAGDAE
jgi:Spy/CpxP family protein refolding chaperone